MIMGIESSCDDSSVAIIDSRTLALVHYEKITQEAEHAKYGGVVPELAARLHTAALPDLIERASVHFGRLKAVAVTCEPGLSVSLIGGVSAARALCAALNLPIIGVNHLIGHIYSLFLEREATLPLGVLLVSGGHTMILEIDANGVINVLASTGDDSFGESFDKVAKMLGLGYPGGAIIEKMAREGDASKFDFTVPLKGDPRLEYSFSGLKNQVRLAIENNSNLDMQFKFDISASFQRVAIAHIMDKLEKIFAQKRFANFGVVGGASANAVLRSNLKELCERYDSNLIFAPLKFCSDNAAMIARAGLAAYQGGGANLDLLSVAMSPRSDLNGARIC